VGEEEVRTLLVLAVLSVTLSSWSERRGRMLEISAPVTCLLHTRASKLHLLANHVTGYRRNKTYQLHRALAKNLFTISLTKNLPQSLTNHTRTLNLHNVRGLETVPIKVLTSPIAHQKSRSASRSRLEEHEMYQLC
jgi:hypothetical protein